MLWCVLWPAMPQPCVCKVLWFCLNAVLHAAACVRRDIQRARPDAPAEAIPHHRLPGAQAPLPHDMHRLRLHIPLPLLMRG